MVSIYLFRVSSFLARDIFLHAFFCTSSECRSSLLLSVRVSFHFAIAGGVHHVYPVDPNDMLAVAVLCVCVCVAAARHRNGMHSARLLRVSAGVGGIIMVLSKCTDVVLSSRASSNAHSQIRFSFMFIVLAMRQ